MRSKYTIKICSIYTFLLLSIVIIRMKLINFHQIPLSAESFFTLLSVTFSDAVFISACTILFILFASFKRYQSVTLYIFMAFAVLNVVICVINIKNVYLLGGPLNYQWLYYSDFMGNSESKKAILANLSWKFVSGIIILCGMVLLGGHILSNWFIRKIQHEKTQKKLITWYGCSLALYLMIAGSSLLLMNVHTKFTANPVIAFTESIYEARSGNPELFTLPISPDFEKFPAPDNTQRSAFFAPSNPKVKNVILFVLESVPAEYVPGYHPQYKVMPNLEKYLGKSMVFSDIYAHSPCTNNSLVSILGSVYPLISYKTISSEHPEMKWPTLSSELKKKNYHTTFLHASDNRFQKIDEFLSHRDFDEVSDYRAIPCSRTLIGSTKEWKYLDGVDEACMGNTFIQWLENQKTDSPFFAMLWTMQTHYPYFTSGPVYEFEKKNKELNRYLNALHHSDEVLGKLINTLETNGLMESTLIVLVGDHGEAFGRHGQKGHAVHIFEENVRVPLILINPLLFSGQQQKKIGGHVDIVPTIFDILKLEAPEEWQGISLFHPTHPDRAYFFNPWTEYLFGYRIANYKIIYNASQGKTMIFDLAKDPYETNDLSETMPEFRELSHQRLACWVQYQKKIQDEKIINPLKASAP